MKRIAIYADSFNGKVGQSMAYMNFVGLFGIPRLVTPQDDPQDIVNSCDALIIPGGADVNPLRYGEAPHPRTGRANAHYEYMDAKIAPLFIDAKKPVIGICRGMQSLNVMFGGSLYQDIKGHTQGADRTATKQTLYMATGHTFQINTIHHQAVKQLGKGLIGIGNTKVFQGCNSLMDAQHLQTMTVKENKKNIECYGFVEVFGHEELPILGFQYHPEEFNCPLAIKLITNLLNPEDGKDRQEVQKTTKKDS